MSETEFKAILEQVCAAKFSLPEEAPEHRFSYRHKRNMERILASVDSAPNEVTARRTVQKRSLKRCIIIAAVLVFLAAFVGFTMPYFISQNFRGDVHREYTRIYPTNTENCPATIEEKYALPEVPEGFEVYETDSTPFDEYICYKNNQTRQIIVFQQMVKKDFGTMHLNTEGFQLEEIEINGYSGLYIDFSRNGHVASWMMWDNGDYVFEIFANLDKESTLDLCKINKM